jgi:hypothetical protein
MLNADRLKMRKYALPINPACSPSPPAGCDELAARRESELAVLTAQCLSRRIPDKQTLKQEVAAWQSHRNKRHAKADWQFKTENARVKLKRLYPKFE